MMNAVTRWLRSLQAQLILWAILPATLVIIALAFTGVYTHQRNMQDFVAERNAVMVQLIAAHIEDGLAHGFIAPDGHSLPLWLPLQNTRISGDIFVIDAAGELLAYTHTQSRYLGKTATLDAIQGVQHSHDSVLIATSEGPLLLSFAPVQGVQWYVVMQEPVAELLGPILRFSSLGPVVALIAAGLSILILAFGWRTIVRPLQNLSYAATQVSWGDHSAIESDIAGVMEVRELHKALHAMVERIEGYETSIRDYLDAMTEGQETERVRLARELHDGPLQTLIALGQRAEMARQLVERQQRERAISVLEDLRETEVSVVEELRRIIRALRPIYLEDLGFLPALEMLVRTANSQQTAEIHLESTSEVPRMRPNVELAAYRIAQEALNNALHHAQAQHITVSVRCEGDGITLYVRDDGVGFTPAEHLDVYTRNGHFGLVGIQERLRQLQGELRIVSETGKGTTLFARIPNCRSPDTCSV